MVMADSDGVTLECWDSQGFFISNKRLFALQDIKDAAYLVCPLHPPYLSILAGALLDLKHLSAKPP